MENVFLQNLLVVLFFHIKTSEFLGSEIKCDVNLIYKEKSDMLLIGLL